MRNLHTLIGLLLATTGYAVEPIRVAVVDTGLTTRVKVKLCKSGHKSFVGDKVTELHGTNVSGLIEQHAGGANYCQIIINWYSEKTPQEELKNNLAMSIKAAIEANADIINISGGGTAPHSTERFYIQKALDKGIKIVAAAGNSRTNLDINCNFYPACYDKRIIVIGNADPNGTRHWSTNYGKVVAHYIVGVNRCVDTICMTGTSQSAAIVTGRIVHNMFIAQQRKNNRFITGD